MAQNRLNKQIKNITIENGCDKKPGSKCGVQVYFLPADKPLQQVASKK